ncbi:MAG: hypothetical protein EXX96DRAFT_574972 [Benjaminiella poitrasii]|nr:MAG: hypothetical protein EXX96DRAFT_574972 [Benjaminiella poitrasii]
MVSVMITIFFRPSVFITMSGIIKVFQSPTFIKLLAESIIKKDCPSFSFVQVEFLGNGSYFVLYMAQSCAILLEIQSNITKISMKQSVKKCLEVFYRFDIQPLLVILCVDKISSTVRSLLSPSLENSHWQIFNSTVWAEKCLIILKDALNSSSSEDELNKLDPLVAFTIYFSDDELQKQKLRDTGNPFMRDIHDC